MFLVRRAKVEDVPTLLKLARMVHFINLPADHDVIMAKVTHSRASFVRLAGGQAEPPARRSGAAMAGLDDSLAETDVFMFTLEDTDTGNCLGTSQIVSRMGGPENPNVSFQLTDREFYSDTLQIGATHTVAQLHLDDTGPSELGGLILQPSLRKHKLRLGRFLSLVRFHFVGLHPDAFADEMIAEMMAPITHDGHNLVWEYLGRRFVGLSYTEADRLCQVSREFITALLPREPIYLTLLPPEARAMVGQVGQETVAARHMLESLGFEYRGFIDPFDGGPHLHASTQSISLVRDTRWATLGEVVPAASCTTHGIVSVLDPDGEFRAIECDYNEKSDGAIALARRQASLLGAGQGDRVGVTPLPGPKRTAARSTKRTKKKSKA